MIGDDLSASERLEIVAASRQEDDWMIDGDAPAAVCDLLHRRGIVHPVAGRWHLTPLGSRYRLAFDR